MTFEDVLGMIDGSSETVAGLERAVDFGRPVGETPPPHGVPAPGVDSLDGARTAAGRAVGTPFETADTDGLDVMEAVLHATDRPAIERTVCEQLVRIEEYAFAWVGRVDLRREAIVPAASAGETGFPEDAADETALPEDAADETALPEDATDETALPEDAAVALDSDDPVARALDHQEPELCRDRTDVTHQDVHEAIFEDVGAGPGGAVAALPLVYGTTEYGVLALYARDSDTLDEHELAVLEVLARVASTAIDAAEARRLLASDGVVELEVTLRSPGLFFADLSRDFDCVLEYEGSLYGTGDGVTMFFVASGVDPDSLLGAARTQTRVADARLVSTGEDSAVLEVTVDAPPLVDSVAERGAETTALRVEKGLVRATFELPAGAEARALVEALEERYESVSLAARRERERRQRSRGELLADIDESLTGRQRLALQKAHVGGFFDWPREVSGEDLADSMDISPSTYHQHLRAAERKVLDALFGDRGASEDRTFSEDRGVSEDRAVSEDRTCSEDRTSLDDAT